MTSTPDHPAPPPVLAYRPPHEDFRPLTPARILTGVFLSFLCLACLLIGIITAAMAIASLTTGRVGQGAAVLLLPAAIASFFIAAVLFVAVKREFSPRRPPHA